MQYAPTNEQGVVFLFSHLLKKYRLTIETIRTGFPDCIAWQKVGGESKKVRIEFEYKSLNFKTHGHSSRRCDWIVCWEHNWADAPKHLQIVELRKEYGLGFNVWILPVNDPYKANLDGSWRSGNWSVPGRAHKGDLILFYHTRPDSCIRDIFVVASSVFRRARRIGKGPLKAPVFLDDLRRDRILKTSGFVRGDMQGRPNASEYWPYLHEMLVKRNPDFRKALAKYAPENLN
jgi:hypothetical protein